MARILRYIIFLLVIVISCIGVRKLKDHLDPNTHTSDEAREDARWIATSKYWLDRNACRYIAICGLAHYHPDPAGIPWRGKIQSARGQQYLLSKAEEDAKTAGWGEALPEGVKLRPEDFDADKRVLKEVPQFVLDAAPLIHLYSKEEFWPSDLDYHLKHTNPYRNHTSMGKNVSHTVDNLEDLNREVRGKFLFMQSKDDVEFRPAWLASAFNKPVPYPEEDSEDEEGEVDTNDFVEMDTADIQDWYDPFTPDNKPTHSVSPPSMRRPQKEDLRRRSSRTRRSTKHKPDPISGRSPAPVILVMVDKGHGIIDAFWFYFYSYNLGTTVLNIRFGNHVGDWEHSLIRFHNGVPKAVFFSAHSGGTAFSYESVEKGKGPGRDGRPVLYSAFGSHAMYAMPGKHPYILPFGLLADVTDKGPLWDPALNYIAYHYNTTITHDVDAKFTPDPILETQLSDIPSALGLPEPDDTVGTLQEEAFVPAANNPDAPTSWFWFNGHWGDKFYELGDERQWRFVGQYHYVNGPLGPRFKNLGRSKVCQSGLTCRILDSIKDGGSWLERRRR